MSEDVCVRFGEKLRNIRLELGYSQEELSFKADLHRTYISSVERGKRNISITNIKKLADALDLKMKDLMPEL